MSVSHTWLAHNLEAALICTLDMPEVWRTSCALVLLKPTQASCFFCPVLRTVHYASLSLPHSPSADGLDTAHAKSGAGSSEAQQQRAFTAAEGFFSATAVVNLPAT